MRLDISSDVSEVARGEFRVFKPPSLIDIKDPERSKETSLVLQ